MYKVAFPTTIYSTAWIDFQLMNSYIFQSGISMVVHNRHSPTVFKCQSKFLLYEN